MNIVIIYATKYGCSEKCAKLLKDKLNGEVELINISNNSNVDLSKYNIFIIGGPIYMGMMNKSITEFCSKNLEILKSKKVGIYVCSMFGGNQGEKNMKNAFPQDLQNIAISMKLFGGELNIEKMKMIDKLITKMVSKAPAEPGQVINKGILEDNINKFAEDINNL